MQALQHPRDTNRHSSPDGRTMFCGTLRLNSFQQDMAKNGRFCSLGWAKLDLFFFGNCKHVVFDRAIPFYYTDYLL